jgi:DUF4097 and DUF4098 domain-containing protein YvlB
MSHEKITQSFDVGELARLIVENIRGSVVVRAGAANAINVQAEIDRRSGSPDQTRVVIQQEDDRTVRAETKSGTFSSFFGTVRPCAVHYVIEVPPACDVRLNCVSSSAVVEGVQGQFKGSTVSGNLSLTNLQGSFTIDLVSGDLTGLRLSGPMEVSGVSGVLQLAQCQIPRLRAKTVSGGLQLESALGVGPYEINSVSGDVRLIVPADTGCEITMSTLSGDAYVGLSSTYHQSSRRMRQITVQDGGAKVSMHSTSGDLAVVTAEQLRHPAPDQPDLPAPAAPVVDRLAILDRIGSGELSVEEGIHLLETSGES